MNSVCVICVLLSANFVVQANNFKLPRMYQRQRVGGKVSFQDFLGSIINNLKPLSCYQIVPYVTVML